MDHTIKIKRAQSLSKIGKYPRTYEAMLEYVPESSIDALTARQLAILIDVIYHACQEAKDIAIREAIDTGAVWDEKKEKMIELKK